MSDLEQQTALVEKLRINLKAEEMKLQTILNKINTEKLGNTFKGYTPIEVLHLPERVYNALVSSNISSLEKLQITPVSELKWIKNLGIKGINILNDICRKKGIILKITS